MDCEDRKHPIVGIEGFAASGKQFDLDITIPEDNRDVIYGVVRDCCKEPVCDAVVKLIEVDKHCKEDRKPVSHTFTDKHGEFVFGPLCPDKCYTIEIWANRVDHIKICAKCHREGKCLRGIPLGHCDYFFGNDYRPEDDYKQEYKPCYKDDYRPYYKEEHKDECKPCWKEDDKKECKPCWKEDDKKECKPCWKEDDKKDCKPCWKEDDKKECKPCWKEDDKKECKHCWKEDDKKDCKPCWKEDDKKECKPCWKEDDKEECKHCEKEEHKDECKHCEKEEHKDECKHCCMEEKKEECRPCQKPCGRPFCR